MGKPNTPITMAMAVNCPSTAAQRRRTLVTSRNWLSRSLTIPLMLGVVPSCGRIEVTLASLIAASSRLVPAVQIIVTSCRVSFWRATS